MSDTHAAHAKHEHIGARMEEFRTQVEDVLRAAPVISSATADPHRDYLAALRTITRISEVCEQYRDLVSAAAHREPNPLSITRIAEASGLSVNTVRSRLPSIKQGRSVDVVPPPF